MLRPPKQANGHEPPSPAFWVYYTRSRNLPQGDKSTLSIKIEQQLSLLVQQIAQHGGQSGGRMNRTRPDGAGGRSRLSKCTKTSGAFCRFSQMGEGESCGIMKESF